MMAILEWLLGLLAKIGLDLWTNKPPPVIVTESEKAGTAQQALSDVETSDAKAQVAATATDRVVRAIATPGGLRAYEANDPNNRDLGQ